jgi:dimeric dUTPase (all-alpha-NTP-PPase superfamily)
VDDKLETMFAMQQELNRRIGQDTDAMSDAERVEWILNYARALGQELAELVDSVPWKWWASYQQFDKHNVKVEVVDIFHFLISLAQAAGLTADDVFAAYTKKNQVNFARQDSGYTVKDESDNRDI